MPANADLMQKMWMRYEYARDNGQLEYIMKAELCERNFRGDQWLEADAAALRQANRPHITINKIMPTISNVIGEQINNRNEISFQPINGSPEETAEALVKVYKYISMENQLDWKRSDMFMDGVITSRGYLDVRMDFNDNIRGKITITNENPKNIIPDPDAEEYDPDSWNEVTKTKWLTADDIEVLYSKADADLLRNTDGATDGNLGFSSIDLLTRDRFGNNFQAVQQGPNGEDMSSVLRNIRVLDRQHKVMDRRKFFIDVRTGDQRPVPDEWSLDKINMVKNRFGWEVISKIAKRVRWTVGAGNVVLHDEWSPYQRFTIVPYFPYFRYGKTLGLVENLLGPQEILNKVSSQELHVVNTSANSGWKVKSGALATMTIEELEMKGAQTGLVLELTGAMDEVEKIQPNQTPQGLDRISYKAEDAIKNISNIGDSQQGMDREDVSGKAIQQKRQASSNAQAKPMDSLQRTDHILARNILDLIQEFMTEEQIITITHGGAQAQQESTTINQVTPEGEIINDLSIGDYAVVMTSVPLKDTLEDSQFEQAKALKEMGIQIPDEVLIDASRLQNKKDIINKIQAASNSPQAQQQQQLQIQQLQADVAKTNAEAQVKGADTQLKEAKAQETAAKAQEPNNAIAESQNQMQIDQQKAQFQMEIDQLKAQIAMMRDKEKLEHEKEMDRQKFAHERDMGRQKLEMEREQMEEKIKLDKKAAEEKARTDRIAAAKKPSKSA